MKMKPSSKNIVKRQKIAYISNLKSIICSGLFLKYFVYVIVIFCYIVNCIIFYVSNVVILFVSNVGANVSLHGI